MIDQCAPMLRLRRRPRVLAGENVSTPAVVGIFRPALLLPARVLREFDPAELRLIVLHELAHLKRHDVAGNWLIVIACIVHWFNPLVWLIAWRVRADRELACDELVLACSEGRDAQAYGQTLLKLIEHLSPRPVSRQLVGIIESIGPLRRRVHMIARFNPTTSSRWAYGLCLLMILGCTALTDAVKADNNNTTQRVAPAAPAATDPQRNLPVAADEKVATAAELQAGLQRVLPEVRFDNVAFTDVVDFLRDTSRVNLLVEWRELEAAGIERNAPVTLQLRRVTLEQTLEHILKDVGGGSVRMEYMIDKGAIVISTEDALAARTQVVFYEVKDLMRNADGKALGGEELAAKTKSLIKLVQDFVSPDSWKDNGGSVGTIAEFNGKLIVTQTPKNHQQVEWLLTKLRENPTTEPAMAIK
jgi:hypothetical protein